MEASFESSTVQPKLLRTRISDLLNGEVDVDVLESFDPAARYLWQMCRYHYKAIIAQTEPERRSILRLYKMALREDAEKLTIRKQCTR